jgi:TonB family protein
MRAGGASIGLLLAVATAAAQGAGSSPRLVAAQLSAAPWNAQGGGIAAYDVSLDAKGAVVSANIVQDVAPFAALLGEAVTSWRFEPAREGNRAVASRVLALALFRPPAMFFAAPTNPTYRNTVAPDELPWPTSVVVPPHPPGAIGSGKVVLEADISSQGAVTAVRVVSPQTGFDGAASDAARQWKYRPAARNGQPVASRAFLVFSFPAVF